MPDYEVVVDGEAIITYTDSEGTTQTETLCDESVVIPNLPEVDSNGSVVVSFRPVHERIGLDETRGEPPSENDI